MKKTLLANSPAARVYQRMLEVTFDERGNGVFVSAQFKARGGRPVTMSGTNSAS